MTRFRIALVALGVTAGLVACVEPLHLGYDWGRSYTAAFIAQADLTRSSVANEQYVLYGIEGTKIRLNVEKAASDKEKGKVTLQQ